MSSPSHGILALTGFNDRAVIALCRSCATNGRPLHLLARDERDPILDSGYADLVLEVRREATLDAQYLVQWIRELRSREGYEAVLVAPTSEFLNRCVLTHRGEIEAAGGIVPLVDEPLYRRVSDKQTFARMCSDHGIPVPAEFATPPSRYPYVAKPLHYAAADGRRLVPHLIMHPADEAAFRTSELSTDFFFQEFVHGESHYLLYHRSRSGEVRLLAQENLLQQPRGGSVVLARHSALADSPATAAYTAMLSDEGFHGLVMIEVRVPPDSGHLVMIEANPRMWGPLQFALDNDVDVLEHLFLDHCGPAVERSVAAPRPTQAGYYFWSGGLANADGRCAFHNFSPDRLVDDFGDIAACDIYLRDDTLGIYRKELARRESHEQQTS